MEGSEYREAGMKLEDTTVTAAGVMRCCLASVATEHSGKEVEEGALSWCKHCQTRFRLVGTVWMPVWQLEREE